MDIGSCRGVSDVLVDELESNLGKFACLEDIEEASISDGDDNSDVDEGYEELESFGPEPVKKCLEKSATFPYPTKGLSGTVSFDEIDDEPETALRLLFSEEPLPPTFSRSLSMPLVSAMKGSREKQGASPRKLSVTWAPDVYDPIPNSLSHTVKGKQKKSRKDKDKDSNNYNKKNGKKRQKGNSSRGGGGKDKKQLRKLGGRSDKCYRTLDACDNLVDPSNGADDFDAGNPDYCGSSFLKKSPTKFHYSVAEAL